LEKQEKGAAYLDIERILGKKTNNQKRKLAEKKKNFSH